MRERMRASPATPSGPPVQVGATSAGLELSRQVPVDLEADADLNEGRGCPGHWSLPYRSRVPTKVDRAGQLRKPLQPQGRTHTYSTREFHCRPQPQGSQ